MKVERAHAEIYHNPIRENKDDETEMNIQEYLGNIYKHFYDVSDISDAHFANPYNFEQNIHVMNHYHITFQLDKDRYRLLSRRNVLEYKDTNLQSLINKLTWIHSSSNKYYLSGSLGTFNAIWFEVKNDPYNPWNRLCQFISVFYNELIANPNNQFIIADEGINIVEFSTINCMKPKLRSRLDFITVVFHLDMFTTLKLMKTLPTYADVSLVLNNKDVTYITPSFYSELFNENQLNEYFECFKNHKPIPPYLTTNKEVIEWLEKIYISYTVMKDYQQAFSAKDIYSLGIHSILSASYRVETWVTMKVSQWLKYLKDNENMFYIYDSKENILKDKLLNSISYLKDLEV